MITDRNEKLMHRSLDQDLSELKDQTLSMGAMVEAAIDAAVQGLISREVKYFAKVHELEKQINEAHMKIDEVCLKLLAKQAPVASDLRFVFSVVKINADLERMGDQAVNIAYNSEHYISKPEIKPLIDLPKMATEARGMVRDAINAFVNKNVVLAKKVLDHDSVVDALKGTISEDLVKSMVNDSTHIRQAMNLILIVRNLERLADHATNIAEEAIFDASGQDIRHGNKFAP